MGKNQVRSHTNDWLTKGILTSTKEKTSIQKDINVIQQLKMNVFIKDSKIN